MTDQQLGPFDANGLLRNPFGTKWTDRQAEAIRQRRADEIEAAVKEREQATAAAESEREQMQRAAGAARLADYEGQCHQRHLHNGGSESDWPAVWRELKQRYLTDQVGRDRVTEDVERLRQDPLYQV